VVDGTFDPVYIYAQCKLAAMNDLALIYELLHL
jgi:hypothetical protein